MLTIKIIIPVELFIGWKSSYIYQKNLIEIVFHKVQFLYKFLRTMKVVACHYREKLISRFNNASIIKL